MFADDTGVRVRLSWLKQIDQEPMTTINSLTKRLCQGIFTDRFIFRPPFLQINNGSSCSVTLTSSSFFVCVNGHRAPGGVKKNRSAKTP